jgi:hypothetical protein
MDEIYKGYLNRSAGEPVPDSERWNATVETRWVEAGTIKLRAGHLGTLSMILRATSLPN